MDFFFTLKLNSPWALMKYLASLAFHRLFDPQAPAWLLSLQLHIAVFMWGSMLYYIYANFSLTPSQIWIILHHSTCTT